MKKFTCSPRRKEGELITKNGLSYTPAQMYELAKRGVPITSANVLESSQFGEKNPSFEVPLDRVRGVDPATMWEHSKRIKDKSTELYNKKKSEFKSR